MSILSRLKTLAKKTVLGVAAYFTLAICVQAAPFAVAQPNLPTWCVAGSGVTEGNVSTTELIICETKTLWLLDNVVNTAYQRARYDSPSDRTEILSIQRQWLVARDNCGPDTHCIAKAYRHQIRRLESFFDN